MKNWNCSLSEFITILNKSQLDEDVNYNFYTKDYFLVLQAWNDSGDLTSLQLFGKDDHMLHLTDDDKFNLLHEFYNVKIHPQLDDESTCSDLMTIVYNESTKTEPHPLDKLVHERLFAFLLGKEDDEPASCLKQAIKDMSVANLAEKLLSK